MTNKKTPVGILGGGISGLAAAFALKQKGIAATVYEKRNAPGGAIRSVRKKGWLVEEGPNTLMVKSEATREFLKKAGLRDQIIEASGTARKRFIVKDRDPKPMPSSAISFLTTPLLTPAAKLRLFKEPFISSSVQHDESIATFIERRLGKEPLDYGVNPFVSGVYAGDPQRLSIKHTFSKLWKLEQKHGSISRGMLKQDRTNSKNRRTLISFKEGNQALPSALARALGKTVRLSTTVTSANKNDKWKISGTTRGTSFEAEHDCLISTLPAYALSGIFGSGLFEELSDLPYAPLSILAFGFEKSQVSHPLDGFGLLIPEVENLNMLGVLFSSTLFPGRAPADHHLLTCFIGGARNPDLARQAEQKLSNLALSELDLLLGLSGTPVFRHHAYWPRAIPQYEVGYDHMLSLIKEIEKKHTGLYIDGNFRSGVSVPDCISSGFETAHKAHVFLKSRQQSLL